MSRLTPLILFALLCMSCVHVPQSASPEDPALRAQRAFLFIEIVHGEFCEDSDDCISEVRALTSSGFLIDYDGKGGMFAITAAHACDSPFKKGLTSVVVTSHDGRRRQALVTSSVAETDLCILYVPKINEPALKLAKVKPSVGDEVFAVSAPLSIFSPGALMMFKGNYAGMFGDRAGFTVATASGSSGSPVLNKRGEVVGMISAKAPRFENFCVSPDFDSIKIIYEVLEDIKRGSNSAL